MILLFLSTLDVLLSTLDFVRSTLEQKSPQSGTTLGVKDGVREVAWFNFNLAQNFNFNLDLLING